MLLSHSVDATYDEWVCEGWPEHDYELRDERDGDRVYDCRRCGAELIETEEDRHAK